MSDYPAVSGGLLNPPGTGMGYETAANLISNSADLINTGDTNARLSPRWGANNHTDRTDDIAVPHPDVTRYPQHDTAHFTPIKADLRNAAKRYPGLHWYQV